MLTTTSCFSKYDQPEFQILCNESVSDRDVNWLVTSLEKTVRDGTRYVDGDLLALGSALLRIRARAGTLILQEPSPGEIPIQWRDGVTDSLRLLRLQKDVAESLRQLDRIDFARLRESLLMGIDVGHDAQEFLLERAERNVSDSGWFIGLLCSGLDYGDPDNLRRVSVFEAISNCPRIAGFLALPTGTRVVLAKDRVTVTYFNEPLIPTKGSLLDAAAN